ncbi:conserved hypothetical protein [Vibrio chagasii]|uniref:hypothetical protein n=1 Tax=Vibrio chagasii TaxID=170679 RepID=UPI001EFE59E2|nr:hypothetical protein [Vibrio chagasii]CAH6807066.1 conserved hypothetical protein [Vibrio chagasii]CAH6836407.1 conserved hypothetical protein [Vibrio chagasii]CAH6838269.1 conserved hypothetical protein [Vibrio chagasii]CAH6863076.1 conserved hypothetical protein [Vibrio chagasii]
MNRQTILFILVVLLPFNAIANSCKIEGYTIGFFNGVATTKEQAKRGQKKIKATLGISHYNGESVEYQLFYNDSYIEGSGLNVLADFAETFDQRTSELEQKQFDRWEAFWDIMSSRQNSAIIKKISATFAWFAGFVLDFTSEAINATITTFLKELASLVDAPETSQTRMKHHLLNDSLTWKGKKLIYIAHSQGNLWVNESYKHVTSQYGYSADNIRVVHIAPASPTLSPDSDYILSTSDLVINGLNFTGIGSVPPPNTVIAPSKLDFAGHGLIPIYLTHPKSIEKLKASVDKAFTSLTKPEMEDFLFKIEFDYSASYDALHDNPVYEIVDANKTDDFGSYLKSPSFYLSPEGDSWFKRNVDSYIQDEDRLPFRVENNAVVLFDTCKSPNETLDDIPSIPSQDTYMFIQWRNLKRFERGTFKDIWRSRKMTDRYGLVDESSVAFQSMDDGYFICVGDGEAIELEATQHFYSEQQRQYLASQYLSGRYDVSARYETPYLPFQPTNLCQGH